MIKIFLNGSEKKVDAGLTLRELLERCQMNRKMVAVEHNEQVVAKEALEKTSIQEGDKIEVVHFVGGGREKAAAKAKAPKKKSGGPTKLVIVESPAKAKTINKFLGRDYLVEASFGHVRDLPKSKMGVDIENNFAPQYIVMMKARQRVKNLKALAKDKDSIYLAPDPDREGEAISWHLAHIFREGDQNVSIQRVEFNEITKDAIRKAFEKPREISMNLVNAQQARRILDRVVGYELSPLLWRKVARGLSAGRVQSIALRFIVEREREIRGFVPQEYWSLEARLSSIQDQDKKFLAKLDKIGKEKASLVNREQTEKAKSDIQNAVFRVESVEKKERARRPQAPFTTSKLQQEAYNRLGFPAAKTMRVAQKLYEGVEIGEEGSVGLITYMRTDSVNLSETAQKEIAQYVRSHYGADYLPDSPPVYKSKKGAQEAHEAIRPSSVQREPAQLKAYLEADEYKLYELIWKKAVSSQMTPAVDEHVTVSILAGTDYYFKTTGRRNLFPGFGIVYGDPAAEKKEENTDDDEAEWRIEDLPELVQGQELKLHELIGEQHFTKPPARFNDASLVKKLEEEGIGRPSTYAPTIATLVYRAYATRKGGALVPSEIGETVCGILVEHFPKVMDVQFTALMEEELDKIEEGDMDWIQVLRDFYEPFKATIAVAREQIKYVKPEDKPTDYTCEKCSKPMVIKWGRFGEFMACSGFPECRNTKSIPTGIKCPEPNCNGDLVKRMSKKRRSFYGCSNYPNCNYIVNKLPKKDEVPAGAEEDKLAEDEIQEMEG